MKRHKIYNSGDIYTATCKCYMPDISERQWCQIVIQEESSARKLNSSWKILNYISQQQRRQSATQDDPCQHNADAL